MEGRALRASRMVGLTYKVGRGVPAEPHNLLLYACCFPRPTHLRRTYSTMNVGSVIVSVSLSVPRVATSDNTTSWYVPLAGVSPPSGEIPP